MTLYIIIYFIIFYHILPYTTGELVVYFIKCNYQELLMDKKDGFIAYFSMEIGLQESLPTYSGGLGVLAGDTIKSCADLGIPVCAVTLLSEKGYFHQHIDEHGNQIEIPVNFIKEDFLERLSPKVTVNLEGRDVSIQAWKLSVKGERGDTVDVYYLDTNLEENSEYDRTLTSFLYGGDYWYRMCQEIILGIGGTRILKALGIHVNKYHMNEGHAGFLVLELLRHSREKIISSSGSEFDIESVRQQCVFTTHTPVPAGHDAFPRDWVEKAIGGWFDIGKVDCFDNGKFNMTLLCLNHSAHVNGVAKRHGEVSSKMFPGHTIDSITNGVHCQTFVCRPFQALFDEYIPGWRQDNFMLRYALNIPRERIWDAHQKAKRSLISHINTMHNAGFKENVLTIGFARRMTQYKRPDLILRDIERLVAISKNTGGLQIVMAGKAHPNDSSGKEKIRMIHDIIRRYQGQISLVYLANYEMYLAKMLVSGCDVWLNTPVRPREASGTSGMKATLNGVLNFSVLDGWWLEGWVEDVTGWSIGPYPNNLETDCDDTQDAEDLYTKLEKKIIPKFYSDKDAWITMMLHSISHNGSFFNTQRMVSQYVMNCYFK